MKGEKKTENSMRPKYNYSELSYRINMTDDDDR